jgi:SP family general alpha glucoside:H+ symporter-like MFS transporter
LNSAFGFPRFNEKFGDLVDPDQHIYEISPAWQAGLTNGAGVGVTIGLLINGYLTDRFGYRMTMIVSFIYLSLVTTVILFFTVNLPMLVVAEVLNGMSILFYF